MWVLTTSTFAFSFETFLTLGAEQIEQSPIAFDCTQRISRHGFDSLMAVAPDMSSRELVDRVRLRQSESCLTPNDCRCITCSISPTWMKCWLLKTHWTLSDYRWVLYTVTYGRTICCFGERKHAQCTCVLFACRKVDNECTDELLAIIDWQTMHAGNPMEDLCRLLISRSRYTILK